MIRRPPRSTLFPTRRSSDLLTKSSRRKKDCVRFSSVRGRRRKRTSRSEEHTSELQSPDHLVCRLLLEKKKKTFSKTAAVNMSVRSGRIILPSNQLQIRAQEI